MSSSDDDFKTETARKRPRTSSACSDRLVPAQKSAKETLQCHLCMKDSIPDLDESHQQLLEFDSLRAHFFCLLFSSGLGQSGAETEGLHGFMPSDIRRELKRGARLKCVYCKKKGATVGCAKQQCKKSYHLPCGIQNGSLQQFFDQFKSYCCSHRPAQKVQKNKQQGLGCKCSICQELVASKPTHKSLWAPCCSAWFHRSCVQTMALNHGEHHFKCPICNNTDKFASEMQNFGIYLPQSDATWEREFGGNNEQLKICGAKVCFCDKGEGRKYHFPDGLWELLACHSCGSCAIHAKCGGMEDFIDPHWYCYVCRRVVKDDDQLEKRQQRPINEIWGTALGRKPHPSTSVTVVEKSVNKISRLPNNTPMDGNADLSNTVTITPIPKNQVRPHHNSFPMRSETPGGVEIRMVVPIQESRNHIYHDQDTIKLSLEDIIIASLNKKPRETNYQCTKAFSEQYEQPVPKPASDTNGSNNTKRHNSLDTEQGSPGDSDYESAQEGLPFKIRKNGVIPNKLKRATVCVNPEVTVTSPSTIDLKIQKSIKDFFKAD